MPIDTAIWVYPIDLQDEGIDAVLDEVRRLGLGGIGLAAAYHAGRLLLPHNPKRAVHFLEDGVAYYHVDSARYAGLELAPRTAASIGGLDLFYAARQAAAARGLSVSAWTILTHNSRLGRAHPSCTIQNVFGDRYTYALCPANPAVRAYVAALCREVADACRPAALELEALGYMGHRHNSHHDKITFPLDGAHAFLLSLCVCTHCTAAIQAGNVDAAAVTERARKALRSYFDRGGQGAGDARRPPEEQLASIIGAEALAGTLRARQQVVASLLEEVRRAVPESTPLRVMASPSALATGASAGIDLSLVRPHLDAIILDLFVSDPGEMADMVRAALASAGAGARIFVNLRAHAPDSRSAEELSGKAAQLRAEGIKGVRFYHYGLVPRAHLEWIRKAVDVLR